MADTGAPARKRNGDTCATLAAAPCCGLPSPLASAIRLTVGVRPVVPAVAKSVASAKPRKRENV